VRDYHERSSELASAISASHQPPVPKRSVSVHTRAVEHSGLRGLVEGQKVSYEVQADRRTGKEAATNSRPRQRPATAHHPECEAACRGAACGARCYI